MDGKGDIGEGSTLDAMYKIKAKYNLKTKITVINLTEPFRSAKYNPFQNASPTVCKDMLINMTDWSEEHYKLNTERYLQRVTALMEVAGIRFSFHSIVQCIPVKNFLELSAMLAKKGAITKHEHTENMELAKRSGDIAEGASARFSTILESELGNIFSDDGIDIYTALKEKSVILFILNPLIYPELSKLFGRLVLIDSKTAISKLYTNKQERSFFILDEINVYASPVLIDLINKSRSANVTCVLATQSLSDLDYACGEAFKEQVIENCNNYILLRQNSSINASHWADIFGTRETVDVTHQLQQQGRNTLDTGLGSARRVREFLYHPDDIKALKTGEGIYVSRDLNYHCKLKIMKPF